MSRLAAVLLTAATTLMPPTPAGWLEKQFGEGDARLRYRLFLPDRYDGSERLPLLVMLHGCTQSAEDFAAGTRLAEIAEREGLLLAFPEQRPDAHPQRCWNWYDPAHQRRDAGEPALIAGIAREVRNGYAVDPDRVYLGGISAGGAMAVNVAAAYPELFAAVGVHSSIPFAAASDVAGALRAMRHGPPDPASGARALREAMGARARVVPLLVLHGAADAVVSSANAAALAGQWARAMAQIAGSAPGPVQRSRETVAGRAVCRELFRAAEGGAVVVESWTVEGLEHAWSGGSPEGSYTDPAGPDASREMVRFFREHPLAAAVR